MNKTLLILTLSLLFSQELEVEGDLKVTGTVESATIDSLNQVIANMQAQITELQAGGGWESRVIEYDFNLSDNEIIYLTVEQFLGLDINNAKVFLFDVLDFVCLDCNYDYKINIKSFDGSFEGEGVPPASQDIEYEYDWSENVFMSSGSHITINPTINNIRIFSGSPAISGTLRLLVTAQFPD